MKSRNYEIMDLPELKKHVSRNHKNFPGDIDWVKLSRYRGLDGTFICKYQEELYIDSIFAYNDLSVDIYLKCRSFLPVEILYKGLAQGDLELTRAIAMGEEFSFIYNNMTLVIDSLLTNYYNLQTVKRYKKVESFLLEILKDNPDEGFYMGYFVTKLAEQIVKPTHDKYEHLFPSFETLAVRFQEELEFRDLTKYFELYGFKRDELHQRYLLSKLSL